MTSTFGMVGKLSSEASNRDKLVSILTKAAELMTAREDCQLYVVSVDLDNDTDVWVMELWESKEAHDQSLTSPEVRELISTAMPLLVGAPGGASLKPVAGI